MKRLQTRAAAAALSALLLALPTCALAAETAPLTLSTQQNAAPVERRTDLGQLSAFGRSHTYMGVSVSDEWLYQARIGGLPLGLSLFTPEGDGVTFREHLCAAQTGGKDIRLCLRAGSQQGGLLLQLDQRAALPLRAHPCTVFFIIDTFSDHHMKFFTFLPAREASLQIAYGSPRILYELFVLRPRLAFTLRQIS